VPSTASGEAKDRIVSLPDSLLARDAFRRVFAATLMDPGSIESLATMVSLEPKSVRRILESLERAGLVSRQEDGWHAVLERVKLSLPVAPQTAPPVRSIPRKQAQRLAFLHEAAALFDVDVEYPEAQVNERLAGLNPDFAALRRYLVEEGLLSRSNGIYRR
jgi:hypothetical protein